VDQLARPGRQRELLQEHLHVLRREVTQAAAAEPTGDVLGHEPVVRDCAWIQLQAGQPRRHSLIYPVGRRTGGPLVKRAVKLLELVPDFGLRLAGGRLSDPLALWVVA
jgi:hypothetical protein